VDNAKYHHSKEIQAFLAAQKNSDKGEMRRFLKLFITRSKIHVVMAKIQIPIDNNNASPNQDLC
jgi:hypothetical protein